MPTVKLFKHPQRRILSKFQVDRFSVMSHEARNLSPSANVSIVCSAASIEDGRVQTSDMDEDEPGRLVRQGTFPLGRSTLRKQGSFRRTKSFRVTFAENITTNDGEYAAVVPPVTPPEIIHPARDPFVQDDYAKISTSKKKIANRKKPARRPTSHVPHMIQQAEEEDEKLNQEDGASSRPNQHDEALSVSKTEKHSSISQFIDQAVITPVEEKLRQLALKYRKPKGEKKSRIPVPTGVSHKSNRVSTLASKFERQFNDN